MKALVLIVIALGWGGVLWAWARDRVSSGSGALPPLSSTALGGSLRSDGPLAAPRTARMARRRRREVLAVLGLLALSTLVLARAWSALWFAHVLVDMALLAYLWAVLSIELPGSVRTRPQLTPVVHPDAASRPRPGPRPVAPAPVEPVVAEPRAEPALPL